MAQAHSSKRNPQGRGGQNGQRGQGGQRPHARRRPAAAAPEPARPPREAFLPVSRADMETRGWEQCDFVYVCGDAYVDHPSFGMSIITRTLEAHGFKVGVICQPDWHDPKSVAVLGEPRLAFLVSAGNMDSMVNHYTVAKRRRGKDFYTPGGVMGARPDHACVVYSNLIRRTYKHAAIVLGGIEASLRRLAHYDYWSDSLKRSILLDSGADLVLYGMGDGTDRILTALAAHGLQAAGVFASDEFVRGQVFHSFPVLRYEEAKRRFGRMLVLLAFGTGLPAVLARIDQIAQEQTLLAPDFPVVGNTPFDRAFCEAHRAELETVHSRLADAQSRRVFEDLLAYKRSWQIPYLRRCETDPDEAYASILRLGPGETLVDLGAYKGDTVQEFVRWCPDYRAIWAVEPDAYSFRRLTASTAGLRSCTCVQALAGQTPGMAQLAARGGRGSRKAASGVPTPVVSADQLLCGQSASFFNIDVEGAEREAILGAAETIRRCRPKLLLAAYHRSKDLFALPQLVFSIRSDYQLYLRHHRQLPAWDVNFYFV